MKTIEGHNTACYKYENTHPFLSFNGWPHLFVQAFQFLIKTNCMTSWMKDQTITKSLSSPDNTKKKLGVKISAWTEIRIRSPSIVTTQEHRVRHLAIHVGFCQQRSTQPVASLIMMYS